MNGYSTAKISTFVVWGALALGFATNVAFAAPGGVENGLQVWLRAGSGISVQNGEHVMLWADSSTNGNNAVFNPANGHGELPPVFDASNPAASDKATVRFSNQNALELDLTWLAASDYTIFVVNGRDRLGLANFYIAGDTAIQDRNLVLGYELPDLLRQAHFNRDLDAFVGPYAGTPVWALDTFRFSSVVGKDLYQDGSLLAFDNVTNTLLSNTGTTLGHFRAFGSLFWFQGDIAEVVIYDRALSEDERFRVEAELAGRYGRPLDVEDYVPCFADWRNNGQYVSRLARAVEVLVEASVLSPGDGELIVSQGARSECGE